MIKSILTPKIIYSVLSNDEELKKVVENKIYPLVVENGTTYPFITYSRDTVTSNTFTKDGAVSDNVDFTVDVISDNYLQSLEIAQLIRKALEKKSLKADLEDDFALTDSRLNNINETYSEGAYIQTLTFSGIVNIN